ncbi:hypothetical protein JOE58_001198 [Curtobacterium luteum]|uniref:Uncharacterized protein n=1 Tax=Curtobacterium luteum TaxID=33881 RepID=A0A8H9G6N6_9MICO|nr:MULTISPECIES: hypothetical protein [Curtobacterium]MBM7801947.1 hypothetical protein [Curtobacterium luteum]NUU51740.1 hypothetical protein [Curtobacterium luteum]GGK86492.1 hypothetical protein GCM10009769_00570 [Curtobacterium luteum]
MHLREIDAAGWLRATGAAVSGGFTAAVFSTRFTGSVTVVVLVGVATAVGLVVLVVAAWAGGGGYAAHRALRTWVRGGSEPGGVRRDRKLRFLRDIVDRTGWHLWLGAALAVVFGATAVADLVGDHDVGGALLTGSSAVLWAVLTVRGIVVDRPHRERAQLLYAELVMVERPTETPDA